MINEVRNTVLSVLNKNNYGYISPSDFNLFAENAQMEIFEEYFKNYNKAIEVDPNNYHLFYNRAIVYENIKKYAVLFHIYLLLKKVNIKL